jgi:anti-sigma B factor antagonist
VNAGTVHKQALRDDVLLLKLGQKLDNNNAHQMVEEISSALESGYRYLIIDMTDLEFLSSAGVGSFLGTVETARAAGGDIILCNVSENITHVLTVLDVADYLTIKTDRGQAEELCGIRG